MPIYDGHYSASFEQQNDQYLSKTSRLEPIQNLDVRLRIQSSVAEPNLIFCVKPKFGPQFKI